MGFKEELQRSLYTGAFGEVNPVERIDRLAELRPFYKNKNLAISLLMKAQEAIEKYLAQNR